MSKGYTKRSLKPRNDIYYYRTPFRDAIQIIVSSIFSFGKIRFFNRVRGDVIPKDVLDVFISLTSTDDEVKRCGAKIFEFFYFFTQKERNGANH